MSMKDEIKSICLFMNLVSAYPLLDGWQPTNKTPQELKDLIDEEMGEHDFCITPQFHNEWNWLMTVVRQIKFTPVPSDPRATYIVKISTENQCIIGTYTTDKNVVDVISDVTGTSLLVVVYGAVVDFIQHYNQENEKLNNNT